ncbi:MAG: hypothetical protein K2L07_12735 [Lachnospiraceae bacterium]|nr:hypothetical protein [Lachnospiraceae bacterium]
MLFLNEFVTYLIKYVVLGIIAVLGVMLGAKYKKNKLAKQADEENTTSLEAEE